MNLQDRMESFWGWLRLGMWRLFPSASLLWRNDAMWQSAKVRRWLASSWFLMAVASTVCIQFFLHHSGLVPSSFAERNQLMENIHRYQIQVTQKQAEGAGRNALMAQAKEALNTMSAQSDAWVAHWPNSALRMPLLSQLQVLATRTGLTVVELKALPLPDAHGFESSGVQMQMKGSERATYAFWQSLDQVFVNGIWPQLSWVRQADGQYLLSAQVQLWWDADDAMTDTGVSVRWHDVLAFRGGPDAVVSQALTPHAVHVFPNQSHLQMRLVGAGLSSAESSGPPHQPAHAHWALVKSGQQVLPIQSGQYLGTERAKMLFANEQGLWGELGEGAVEKLILWEGKSP